MDAYAPNEGFRLVIADHAQGFPVFRALSLCTCCRHYPGAATERIASLTSLRVCPDTLGRITKFSKHEPN